MTDSKGFAGVLRTWRKEVSDFEADVHIPATTPRRWIAEIESLHHDIVARVRGLESINGEYEWVRRDAVLALLEGKGAPIALDKNLWNEAQVKRSGRE